MTAAEALTHPWLLQEAPRPCPHDCMPQFAKKEK